MSDFVPRDVLPDLWEEILRRHWSFLETEESMQKLEERKKLEDCLKDFLCKVPHDRKFFLPETAHVLKKSIKDMDDFTAYKAMIGFESISQYANNLFTKPWRKEYRVIKMYSGFYQHEIKSNLVDAERLFEAMGYRHLVGGQMLILDGPICPDQVTNVSRDAMAAYVECQIMKQAFSSLAAMQLSCSWTDIFNYREAHVGGASSTAKGMAYAIRERRLRKENSYATIQYPASSCSNCMQPLITNGCELHHPQTQIYSNVPCSVHNQYSNVHFKAPSYPHMSHSRSLEHYSDVAAPLPHRHSFDQPGPCEKHLYDCVDGYANGCQFAAYSHPYNVSGNRYPLPYNISSQLNSQYACPSYGPSPPLPTADRNGFSANAYARPTYRQRSFSPTPQLIDFEEEASAPSQHSRSQSRSFDYADPLYDGRASYKPRSSSHYQAPRNLHSRNAASSDELDSRRRPPPKSAYKPPPDDIPTLPTLKSSKNKNQDGVGSFESWDYVFQNLEKHGYAKDVDERDLLVQSLDLDSMKLSDAPPKPKAHAAKTKDTLARPHRNGTEKSILKLAQEPPPLPPAPNKRSSLKNGVGASNNHHDEAGRVPASTSEWSCRFCTFLNPDTKRICDMCCRSKDFNVSNTPTCV